MQDEKIKVSDDNRAEIIQQYTQSLLDSMDFESVMEFAHDGVVKNLNNYSNTELEKEISEFYPEILETK